MSGLAAGIRSAYYDQKVCILERHNTIGGLNSFYRLRGRNYDVGLHAVTNFTPRGTRRGPFARLLRQLRLTWDDFGLSPQLMSSISFPNVELAFDNNIDLLRSEVARAFPNQIDNFEILLIYKFISSRTVRSYHRSAVDRNDFVSGDVVR